MTCRMLIPILHCSDCRSHLIELRGPVTDNAVVRCAKCRAGIDRWVEFVSDLDARMEWQQERRGRSVRYRAKKRADPASAWHLILSIPFDEFYLEQTSHTDPPL